MQFQQLLQQTIEKKQSLVCIGLDPVLDKMPENFRSQQEPLFAFCKEVIDQTHQYATAFKPNSAFFEAFGAEGIAQLKKTVEYIHTTAPDTLVLLDAKRGDIESTNNGYVQFAYEYLNADAITLHPYLGKTALQPFLDREDKGAILLCHTSNPGAAEFQEVQVHAIKSEVNEATNGAVAATTDVSQEADELYIHVARTIANTWNEKNNCMLVVGATYPEQMLNVRKVVGDMPILVPGIGAQGGDLEATLKAGLTQARSGLLIAASRSILYAENPGVAAQELHNQIQDTVSR